MGTKLFNYEILNINFSRLDDFFKYLNELLKQLLNDSQLLLGNSFINLTLYICPMIFLLFNYIDEENLLKFCSTQKEDFTDENENNDLVEEAKSTENYIEFMAK